MHNHGNGFTVKLEPPQNVVPSRDERKTPKISFCMGLTATDFRLLWDVVNLETRLDLKTSDQGVNRSNFAKNLQLSRYGHR